MSEQLSNHCPQVQMLPYSSLTALESESWCMSGMSVPSISIDLYWRLSSFASINKKAEMLKVSHRKWLSVFSLSSIYQLELNSFLFLKQFLFHNVIFLIQGTKNNAWCFVCATNHTWILVSHNFDLRETQHPHKWVRSFKYLLPKITQCCIKRPLTVSVDIL